MTRGWMTSEVQTIRRRMRDGDDLGNIAADLGRTPRSIGQYMSRQGGWTALQRANKRAAGSEREKEREQRARAVAAYDANPRDLQAIAEEHGRSMGTVLRWVRATRPGVDMRANSCVFDPKQRLALVTANMNGATYAALAREHGCAATVIRATIIRQRKSIGLPDRGDLRRKMKQSTVAAVRPSPGPCALTGCGKKATVRSKYCSIQCRVKNAHRRARG